MSKQSLRFLAVLLTVGIVVVLFAGLDGLPRDVKAQIAAERKSFTAAQSQLQSAQADVSRDLASEADLFRALPSAREYPDRLDRAAASLAAAGQNIDRAGAAGKAKPAFRSCPCRIPAGAREAGCAPPPWPMPKAFARTRRIGST